MYTNTLCVDCGQNPPHKVGAKLCAACLKAKQHARNHRHKPLSHAPCAQAGCQNEHHGRSRYCVEHIRKPRGAWKQRSGPTVSVEFARHLLLADDLPQRLSRPQRVTLLNVKTMDKREVLL